MLGPEGSTQCSLSVTDICTNDANTQVVVAVLVTATVLLPPRVKLIMFDGHRYHRSDGAKGAEGKAAAEVALTLAPLLGKYPQQHSWLVLGLDAHVCKVLQTMQVRERALWVESCVCLGREEAHSGERQQRRELKSACVGAPCNNPLLLVPPTCVNPRAEGGVHTVCLRGVCVRRWGLFPFRDGVG